MKLLRILKIAIPSITSFGLYYFLTPLLPETPYDIINQEIVKGAAVLGISFAITYYIVSSLGSILSSTPSLYSPSTSLNKSPKPTDKVPYTCYIIYEGLAWSGKYVISGVSNPKKYAYIEGPFCPYCNGNLVDEKGKKWLVLETDIWKCPSCPDTFDRDNRIREVEAVVETLARTRLQQEKERLSEEKIQEYKNSLNYERVDEEIW
jgi:hypothetical protein